MFNDKAYRINENSDCNTVSHRIIYKQEHPRPRQEIHQRDISVFPAKVKYCLVYYYKNDCFGKNKEWPESYTQSVEEHHIKIISRLSGITIIEFAEIKVIIPVFIYSPVSSCHVTEAIEKAQVYTQTNIPSPVG